MLNTIVLICTNIFEIYVIYRFMHVFFQGDYKDESLLILAYLLRLGAGIWWGIWGSYPIVNLISNTITTLLIALCYNQIFIRKLIATIITIICMFLSEAVVAFILKISDFGKIERVDYQNSNAMIMIEIILWIMTIFMSKLKNLKQETYIPKRFVISMFMITTFSFYMELLVFRQKNVSEKILFSSLICVLMLNFVMVYLYDSLSEVYLAKMKVEFEEREKEYYHKQSELLQKNDKDLKEFRHDEKNKLLVLKQMIEKNENKKALQYLSKIDKKLNHKNTFATTGNIALDSVINYKLSVAKEEGIEVSADIFIPVDIKIEDDDFVIIFSNLLDNSIEASERLQENKYIDIKVKYEKDCLKIRISNRFDSVLKEIDGKIETRKENKSIHGIGISSVQSVVNKYEGILSFRQDKDIFIVNILLYV